MNNNAALGMFIGKGLGGFDGGFAVAVLNDNVASMEKILPMAKMAWRN
jgi:hypothetical protein